MGRRRALPLRHRRAVPDRPADQPEAGFRGGGPESGHPSSPGPDGTTASSPGPLGSELAPEPPHAPTSRCCRTCRLLGDVDPCAVCGGEAVSGWHADPRLVMQRANLVMQLDLSSELKPWKALAGVIAFTGAMVWIVFRYAGPDPVILLSPFAGMALIVVIGMIPGLRRRLRARRQVVPNGQCWAPPPKDESWTGVARALGEHATSWSDGSPCLVSLVTLGVDHEAPALRATRAVPFLVARPDGDAIVVDGCLWLETTPRRSAIDRSMLSALGVPDDVDVQGHAWEQRITEGARVAVRVAATTRRAVPQLGGYRGATADVVTGVAGQPVQIEARSDG